MNSHNPSDETERKILNELLKGKQPKPVQEIADAVQCSYDDALKYLDRIGKLRPIRFINITDTPGALQAVEIVMGSGS